MENIDLDVLNDEESQQLSTLLEKIEIANKEKKRRERELKKEADMLEMGLHKEPITELPDLFDSKIDDIDNYFEKLNLYAKGYAIHSNKLDFLTSFRGLVYSDFLKLVNGYTADKDGSGVDSLSKMSIALFLLLVKERNEHFKAEQKAKRFSQKAIEAEEKAESLEYQLAQYRLKYEQKSSEYVEI